MGIEVINKNLLVFDFDGTIADTMAVSLEIINTLADEFSFEKIGWDEAQELKGKKISELLKMSGLTWLHVPKLVRRARALFKLYLDEIQPIDKMPETIRSLSERGYRMGILTSNTQEAVQSFLETHDLQLFEFIHAPDSIFGKSKVLKQILKKNRLIRDEIVMIGDEIRDVHAAQKAKVDSIAVSWGFNNEKILHESEPSWLISDPGTLLEMLPPKDFSISQYG